MKSTIETQRLVLRPWNSVDIKALVEGLNNIDVSKWLAVVPYPYLKDNAEEWMSHCMVENDNAIEFAIELKAGSTVIGGVSINKIDTYQGTAGGGIWINANYHGHGYGTEAFGKRIEFAFEKLGLRRLNNGFLEGNPSSFKMQEKFGYKIEGVRRKAVRCLADGELKDEFITGLLKEEWKK